MTTTSNDNDTRGEIQKHLKATVDSIPADRLEQLHSYLLGFATHIADRIHYAETRRSNLTFIAAGLFAGSLAILSIVVAASHDITSHPILLFPLGSTSLVAFVTSLVMWTVYAWQTNFR